MAANSFEKILQRFDYAFPQHLIASEPARPRDHARLLIYDRHSKRTQFARFKDLGAFLPKGSVLVLNDTKVIPARLTLHRSTGGRISVLWLGKRGSLIHVLANRRLRPGEILKAKKGITFVVERAEGRGWLLRSTLTASRLQKSWDAVGEVPLPPYIKHTRLSSAEQRRAYQTVFAKNSGSIAAPTASLHFTRRLLKDLERQGVKIAYVTLHVHLGTFAPLTEDQWKKGKLHQERYGIPARTQKILATARAERHQIIAVGTTVVRALESASNEKGRIVRPKGATRLFIKSDHIFHLTNGLITNFHVPKSSLLMLVSAFVGREKLLELYREAIKREFRLFSFGDGMLIV